MNDGTSEANHYPLLEALLAAKGLSLLGIYTNRDAAKIFGVVTGRFRNGVVMENCRREIFQDADGSYHRTWRLFFATVSEKSNFREKNKTPPGDECGQGMKHGQNQRLDLVPGVSPSP